LLVTLIVAPGAICRAIGENVKFEIVINPPSHLRPLNSRRRRSVGVEQARRVAKRLRGTASLRQRRVENPSVVGQTEELPIR